jgi:hypothetical protein
MCSYQLIVNIDPVKCNIDVLEFKLDTSFDFLFHTVSVSAFTSEAQVLHMYKNKQVLSQGCEKFRLAWVGKGRLVQG